MLPITFKQWLCHQHPKGIKLQQITDPVERKLIASEPPRLAQLHALQRNTFNPYTTNRDNQPSYQICQSARKQFFGVNLMDKIKEIQQREFDKHASETNVSMMFKGRIHQFITNPAYFTLSLFSKKGIQIMMKLTKYDEPAIYWDSTEKLIAKIGGRKVLVYKARIPSLTGKELFTPFQCITNRGDEAGFDNAFN